MAYSKAETLLCHKGPSSQSYGFSSSHVWMWELDCKESWVLKNWCFWTVVLEKTLESPLDCKEIQTVHPKGDQSWVFFGRTDAKAETPILWPPDAELTHWKRLMLGGIGNKRRRWRQRMAGWHHRLDGHEFGWAPGVGDGQGGLACCNSVQSLSHVRLFVTPWTAWGGQSIWVSASASVLPKNTQDWSPLGWTVWISLQSKGSQSQTQLSDWTELKWTRRWD